MSRRMVLLIAVVLVTLVFSVAAVYARGNGNPHPSGVIYVYGQELYYDTIVVKDPLPPNGPFQLLESGGPNGLNQTEFGPGDPGYLGGRWKQWTGTEWHYFLCPLLGPGRAEP